MLNLQKRLRDVVLSALVLVLPMLLTACAGRTDVPKPSVLKPLPPEGSKTPFVFDLTVAKTMGNHTWIPINREGSIDLRTEMILVLLNEFQRIHPDLEILDVDVEFQPLTAYGYGPYLYGIWLLHRLR